VRTDLVKRTHCAMGHLFNEANTYRRASRGGARECRTCRNARHREQYERRRIGLGRRYRPRGPLTLLDRLARLPKNSPIYERLAAIELMSPRNAVLEEEPSPQAGLPPSSGVP
jgi:hypothetical protein